MGGRHCRNCEGSKVKMVWTRNKKRRWRASQRHYEMKRWYGHRTRVIRRDEGERVTEGGGTKVKEAMDVLCKRAEMN